MHTHSHGCHHFGVAGIDCTYQDAMVADIKSPLCNLTIPAHRIHKVLQCFVFADFIMFGCAISMITWRLQLVLAIALHN